MSVDDERNVRFWANQPATASGMLNGYDSQCAGELESTARFLERLDLRSQRALDLGAGVGRVVRGLLAERFQVVDAVERNERFCAELRQVVSGQALCCSIQQWNPPPEAAYDLILLQWVVLYLNHRDLVRALRACKRALRDGRSRVVVKANTVPRGRQGIRDEADGSWIRSRTGLHRAFTQAGLKVVLEVRDSSIPDDEMLPVWMFALTGKDR